LGQTWQAHGGTVTLLSYGQHEALRQRIASTGVDYCSLKKCHPDPEDLYNTLRLLARCATHTAQRPWLVLDGYHFDPAYQQAIRTAGYRLLMIDDTAHWPQYHADVLMNQNMQAEEWSYPCPPETLLLLGTRYVLLRPEFLPWHAWHRDIPAVARKLLVTLGGGDPDNVTLQVLKALPHVTVDDLEVVLIVGAYNPHYAALQEVVKCLPLPIRLIRDAHNMPELMAWADVAVAGAGSTSWEMAFLGLPSVLLVLAPNQERNATGLAAAGAAISMRDSQQMTAVQLANLLTAVCHDQTQRQALSLHGRQVIDGKGGERIVSVLTGLDDRFYTENSLEIRQATLQDALPIWRLANDPVVRSYSFHPDPIPLDRHLQWFTPKIASPESCFWVGELGGTLVAQIRYDRIDPETLAVHFAVIPGFRGKGLGTKALMLTGGRTCQALGAKRVRGIVFTQNIPSLRAFIKAGFQHVSTVQDRGHDCAVFERLYT
jgi:UDP-2,4-diacetamido-2,4,6-trideoxy-beta-L-altropyranose hydrolase